VCYTALSEVALSYFHQAIDQLIDKIRCASDKASRCWVILESDPNFDLIDWLDAQPIYPKFFWTDRDAREKVVALGQLYSFLDPAPAYQILSEGQRVWGGRSFDGHSGKNPRCMSSLFFLPQIELIHCDDEWRLAANMTQDRERTISSLKKLVVDVTTLKPICADINQLQHVPDKANWQALTEKALDEIQAKTFKKVVLARETTVQLDRHISAAQLLKASYESNHNSFHFMLVLDSKHSFVGSPPERLYQRFEQTLLTEALAGTIGRGDNAQHDAQLSDWLVSDDKNLTENQYVVDDIIERLIPYSKHIEVDENPQLIKLRKVQHLKRSIQADLNSGVKGGELLGALQPTAAVAGLPRQPAIDFIQQYEPFPRGWYAGSVGYISHSEAQFCVAIRSALVVDNSIKLYAGAGIITGSVAEHEWLELDRKVSTLLSLITDRCPLEVAS
jgi:menaquinone-specific isochorismate synthase